MKVLIAGAGIGGLSAAISFKNNGHEVYCFDRVKEMRPIGAAISGTHHAIPPSLPLPAILLHNRAIRIAKADRVIAGMKQSGQTV